MSGKDKASNKAQEVKGHGKEKVGRAVGNESLEADGSADRKKGSLKQAGEKTKDAFRR
jgi:uncharacterized protein YjbJ (UPF0337 family)